MRALLGLLLFLLPAHAIKPARNPPATELYCATTTTSEATGTADATAAGLSWTPPSTTARYRVRAFVRWTASANGVGLFGRVDPGNATGGCWGSIRGANSTSEVVYHGVAGSTTTNSVSGTTSPSTAGDSVVAMYECALTSASSAPTAVTFAFRAETSSGGTVTVQPGSCLEVTAL